MRVNNLAGTFFLISAMSLVTLKFSETNIISSGLIG